MSFSDIKKMPLSERIHLMEQIWDTLRYEDNEIDSPQWHEEILQMRKESVVKKEAKLYTVSDIKKRRR